MAALDDAKFLNESVQANAVQRNFLYNELTNLGYHTIASHANFVYLWFDSDEKKKSAYNVLFNHAIIVCDLKIFGQEKALRFTVGTNEINKQIITILSQEMINVPRILQASL